MAGGIAVVLGVIGANFGAGMTGGMAFVYDADDSFARKANPDSIVWQRLASANWETIFRNLIEAPVAANDSTSAAGLPEDWDPVRGRFSKIVPKDMIARPPDPLDNLATLFATDPPGPPPRAWAE